MTRNYSCPIEDWTHEGRRQYIDENRDLVELTISQGLDEIGQDVISNVFGTEDKAISIIIDLFRRPDLDPKKAPARDVTLFTQIRFWVKYKTAGSASTLSKKVSGFDISDSSDESVSLHGPLQDAANCLSQFSQKVAPDLVHYWLKANKRLLDEIQNPHSFNQLYAELENPGSPSKASKYKADASFRYLYLFCNLEQKITDEMVEVYEKKYLTRGSNKPQYTAEGYEGHTGKAEVRKAIRKIIDIYINIYPDASVFQKCLFKAVAKKSLVDLYEFEDIYQDEFRFKLSSLKPNRKLKESVA